MPDLEHEFRELCKAHDISYQYSDDPRVWRAGEQSYERIKAFAKQLPRDRAVAIWNEVCDQKFAPQYAREFYWKL